MEVLNCVKSMDRSHAQLLLNIVSPWRSLSHTLTHTHSNVVHQDAPALYDFPAFAEGASPRAPVGGRSGLPATCSPPHVQAVACDGCSNCDGRLDLVDDSMFICARCMGNTRVIRCVCVFSTQVSQTQSLNIVSAHHPQSIVCMCCESCTLS